MAKNRKLVEVVWEDAHSGTSAQTWADYNEETQAVLHNAILCNSVGYVLHDTKDRLVIASSINHDDDGEVNQVSGTMSIPRGMIRKVRVLK